LGTLACGSFGPRMARPLRLVSYKTIYQIAITNHCKQTIHFCYKFHTGSRFTETVAFGFVALDIKECTNEDIGVYTCTAVNSVGQAITSAKLHVTGQFLCTL